MTTLAANVERKSGFADAAIESNFEPAAESDTGSTVVAMVASNWRGVSETMVEERSSAVAETAANTRQVAEARIESNSRLVAVAARVDHKVAEERIARMENAAAAMVANNSVAFEAKSVNKENVAVVVVVVVAEKLADNWRPPGEKVANNWSPRSVAETVASNSEWVAVAAKVASNLTAVSEAMAGDMSAASVAGSVADKQETDSDCWRTIAAENVAVTSVDTLRWDSPGVRIFDTAIDAAIAHAPEDKRLVVLVVAVAHRMTDKPETEDDFAETAWAAIARYISVA